MAKIRLDLREADGDIPAVCMRCGRPATMTISKRMQWCPPWVGVLIVFGLLPYAIVASIMTRRALVRAPFCDDHKRHWFTRATLIWGSLLLFLVLGIGSIVIFSNLSKNAQDNVGAVFCIGGVALIVTWLGIIIWAQATGIRPQEITDMDILITGVSAEFVDAVAELDRERKERRLARRRERERPGRWRDEADEDDDLPRRRRPADDPYDR